MKITPLITSLFITSAALLTLSCISCNGSASGTTSGGSSTPKEKRMAMVAGSSSYYSLPGEDTIYLPPDTMQVATANRHTTLMSQCLFYPASGGELRSMDTLDDEIDTANFRTLYTKAAALGNASAATTRKVTALAIKYGIHNNTIVVYYKPLCLAWDGTINIKGVVYNNYTNLHAYDSTYYIKSASGLIVAGYKLQFQPDSANYVTNIRIKHHKNAPSATGFNWATDSTGDARCLTFPFQEIFALMKNNPQSDSLKICNQACPLPVVTSSPSPFIKHSVIIGPKNFSGSGSGLFYNVYADLGGLCPPSCKDISFELQ